MYKHFTLIFITLLSLSIVNAKALPIVEADAFAAGDKLAVFDSATGITWMDFGVNNGLSFNDVMNGLSTVYQGWRLPTEGEVRNLWDKLTISDTDESYQIFSVFGANKTPVDHLPYLCSGFFIDDSGYIATSGFIESGTIINGFGANRFYQDGVVQSGVYAHQSLKYDPSNPYFNLGGTAERSTLLVRNVSVPEPSALVLLLGGLISLGIFRRKRR